jgi:hypothetical protein
MYLLVSDLAPDRVEQAAQVGALDWLDSSEHLPVAVHSGLPAVEPTSIKGIPLPGEQTPNTHAVTIDTATISGAKHERLQE